MKLQVVLCLALGVPTLVVAAPMTWGDGNGHAYEIVVAPGITWDEAAAIAASRGGYLASITGARENQLIYDLANGVESAWRLDGAFRYGPWLGAVQMPEAAEPSGGWTWANGDSFDYTNWNIANNQPNDATNATTPPGNQDRIAFGNQRNGEWADFQGNYEINSFVVEYDSSRPVYWTENGHRYELVHHADGLTWHEAQALAQAKGGYLATLTSAAENAFVASLLADVEPMWVLDEVNKNLGPWLGGQQLADGEEPEGGWVWVNDEGPFSYTNWNEGQPNDNRACCTGGNQDRLHVYSDDRDAMRWGDYQGSNLISSYIVEYSAPVPENDITVMMLSGMALLGAMCRRNKRG